MFAEQKIETLGDVIGLQPDIQFCPCQVITPWSMTGFTGNIDLRPAAVETIVAGFVAFAEIGGMTISTHVVPVLLSTGPVQLILMINDFVRIKVEPALATGIFRSRVPGDTQRLQAPVRELYEILLQGCYTERVLDFKVLQPAVFAVGINEEFAIFTEKSRSDAVACKFRIVEITQHSLFAGVLHGQIVM